MVLQLDTVRWSWWYCAAPAWVSCRRSSVSCIEIVRILIQISLRPVVARSHRSHAGVALAWAPAGALIWDCSGARTLNARSQGLRHRVVLVRLCLPGHQSDGESSNFVREIHLFLDPGSLWAAQVLSSPATVMKAFQIDALIAREYGRAGIAAAGHPCRKAKNIGDINDSLWDNESMWAAHFYIRTGFD